MVVGLVLYLQQAPHGGRCQDEELRWVAAQSGDCGQLGQGEPIVRRVLQTPQEAMQQLLQSLMQQTWKAWWFGRFAAKPVLSGGKGLLDLVLLLWW